jgi:putative aldouronate transport system substrate-binding protein
MKKIIALLLVLALAVSCFVGCEKTPADDTKAPVTPTGDNTPDDTTAEPVVEDRFDGKHEIVEVTVVIRNAPQPDDLQVVAAMNKILAERYNLKLNLKAIPDAEYQDRITLMMTSGETWDWCYTASWTNNYWDRAEMGAFYDLYQLKDTESWKELMEVYPEGWYDNAVVDGQLFGLPNYQIEYSPSAYFIQKEYADKYNLPYKNGDYVPTDVYDPEFYAWMERVKEGEPDMMIIRPAASWMGAVKTASPAASVWNEAGLDYDDTTDYKVYNYNKENKETELDRYEKMLKLIQDGFIREDAYTMGDDTADYKALKYVMDIGTGKPGGDVDRSVSMGTEYIQVYRGNGDYYRTATGGMTTVLGMNYASKDPEAALEFLKVMWTDVDLYNMFVHGLEGEHYTKVGENRVEPIADSGYSRSGYAWGFGNQFNAWLLPGQADDVWEQTIKMNSDAKPINVPGLRISTANVATEVGAVKTVKAEYEKQWMTCKDRAELEKWYDTFMQKLEEAGVDAIIADVQTQVDAWRTANGK